MSPGRTTGRVRRSRRPSRRSLRILLRRRPSNARRTRERRTERTRSYLRGTARRSKYVLVVGVELLSRFLDFSDRTTCVLFGDGSGAANTRILKGVGDRVGIAMDRFYMNIDRYGNTSSASAPIALDEAVRDGSIQKGQYVLVCALGGGISWGSALIRW